MPKKKKRTKLPEELQLLFDDKAQQEAMDLLIADHNARNDVYRAIWRRLFKDVIPPWIITDKNREQLEDPGPYAIKSLLTGELCVICDRPLYLTANHEGITCAGGHGADQCRKKAKELLDGDGEYAELPDPSDFEFDDIDDDDLDEDFFD